MSEKSAGEGLGNDPLNEIFSGPADQRDLSEMVARDGKPLFTRSTVILGLAALFLGGIIVGAHFESQNASAAASSATVSALRNAFAGQGSRSAAGASAFGVGGFSAPVAAGQIKLIDGQNIYVTTDTGSIVKVSTDSTTRIRQSAALTIGQLKVGDTVSVSGQSGSDGTVTATSINVDVAQGGTPTPVAKPSTDSSAPSTTKTPTPSGAATRSAGGSQKLIACMQKKGIKVDPTQGTRALRNSTDPKVQAAFTACRTSAFPSAP